MRIIVAGGVLIVSGCVALPPTSASGTLDVTIPTSNRKCVIDDVANKLVDRGYLPTSQTDAMLVAQKKTSNLAAGLLLASEAYTEVDERITVNFIDNSEGVRVILRQAYVGNPGSAFEHLTPIDVRQSVQDQASASVGEVARKCNASH